MWKNYRECYLPRDGKVSKLYEGECEKATSNSIGRASKRPRGSETKDKVCPSPKCRRVYKIQTKTRSRRDYRRGASLREATFYSPRGYFCTQ